MWISLLVISFFHITNPGVIHPPGENVTIHFNHTANGNILLKGKALFTPGGSEYKVTRLKYYVSHVSFNDNKGQTTEIPGEYLIDAFSNDSFNLSLPYGKYKSVNFMIGLDSAKNVAGAGSGALDPLNDMYWAWNTGFVHFKLEGTAQESIADLNRIQYHIGGYAGKNSTQQFVTIPINKLHIKRKSSTVKRVELLMNLDALINNETDFKKTALIMKAGKEAVNLSSYFPAMFSLKKEPRKISTSPENP